MLKLRAGLTALLLVLFTAWTVVPAAAQDSAPITKYHVDANLTEDGVAHVTVNFTMDFGAVSGRGPYFLFLTQQDGTGGQYYVFDYSNIQVSSPSERGPRTASGCESATRMSPTKPRRTTSSATT